MNVKHFYVILFRAVLYSCTTYRDEVHSIASEAGIPLIQVAYSKGNRSVCMEVSIVEEDPEREDRCTVFQAASLSNPVFAYIVMRMADSREIFTKT